MALGLRAELVHPESFIYYSTNLCGLISSYVLKSLLDSWGILVNSKRSVLVTLIFVCVCVCGGGVHKEQVIWQLQGGEGPGGH